MLNKSHGFMKGKIELFSTLPPLIYKGELCFVSSIWIVCIYIVDYVRTRFLCLIKHPKTTGSVTKDEFRISPITDLNLSNFPI